MRWFRVVRSAAGLRGARALFSRRAGGPHTTGVPIVAQLPTVDEILIGQTVVKEVLGEKDSEERARANELSERGLIDLEEGLGHWLADRFVGELPATEKAARGMYRKVNRCPRRDNSRIVTQV